MEQLTDALKDKIVEYLTKYEKLRDDWQYLLALIWREQIGEQNHTTSCFVFLGLLAKRDVVSPESVRRTWQKVLEERPDLRGPEYGKRHKITQKEFKIQLKQLGESLKGQQKLEL